MMILRFEEALLDDAAEQGAVMPLEFVSLDEPAESLSPAMEPQLEALWRERVVALEMRLEEQSRSAQSTLDAARDEAQAERLALVEEKDRIVAQERQQVSRLIASFDAERERYFSEVEREVVSLALAIAERVLHREAAMDPMLLRSVVRVALEKVAGESRVTLRVPAGQAASWREALTAEHEDDAAAVMEDKQLSIGDAVLETAVGRVELGVREQLKEVERGFFDLLAMRPQR
jgi:flagellar assembly protein FliH